MVYLPHRSSSSDSAFTIWAIKGDGGVTLPALCSQHSYCAFLFVWPLTRVISPFFYSKATTGFDESLPTFCSSLPQVHQYTQVSTTLAKYSLSLVSFTQKNTLKPHQKDLNHLYSGLRKACYILCLVESHKQYCRSLGTRGLQPLLAKDFNPLRLGWKSHLKSSPNCSAY